MAYQPPSEKWHLFENVWPSHTKRFVCCALTIRYIIYSTVGRSIASISNHGGIFVPRRFAPRVGSAMTLPTIQYILHITLPRGIRNRPVLMPAMVNHSIGSNSEL